MNFTRKNTTIPGCYEIQPVVRRDERGRFVKVFQSAEFKKLGLETDFKEEFYTVSRRGVLRGMHFQAPPAALNKLVSCVYGEALDAVLDLRKKSRTYGKVFTIELSSEKANMLYIPKGCAHGFYTLSKTMVMCYKTSQAYRPEQDTGVLWNSAGIKWPWNKPVVSERDRAFRRFDEFSSPF